MHVCPECGYSESELVTKAKKYDELSKRFPVTVIEKDAMLVNIDYFDQIKEKAQNWDLTTKDDMWKETLRKAEKWDEHATNDSWSELREKAQKWDKYADTISTNEYIEKAQKWDDVCSNNHPTKTLLLTERYLEYKDKAQKWDELIGDGITIAGGDVLNRSLLLTWKDKAQKWDAHQKTWKDMLEKAKKWDAIVNDSEELRMKARKYDEITKLVRSLGTLNLYALSKKIEEMLR